MLKRTIKGLLFEVIQEAVDLTFNFEEEAISIANSVLDGFIVDQLRLMVAVQAGFARRAHINKSLDFSSKGRGLIDPTYGALTTARIQP